MALIFVFSLGQVNKVQANSPGSVGLLPPGTEVIRNIPIDAVFYNPCCDEDVHLFGTALLVINENVMHVVVSGITGTGLTTGYDYEGRGPSVETNVFYSDQFTGILTFMLNLTNDEGCSFKLKVTLQIHYDANGNLTAEVEHFDVKCN
jgi:hypothetical protein